MWIKICANTNLDDAQLAAQLGADAVGFVFAPSPRRVTPAQAALITPHLPSHIERVGVFPALDARHIAQTARIAHLDAVQLHGLVDLDLLHRLRSLLPQGVNLIQTVHWTIHPEAPGKFEAGNTEDDSPAELARHLRSLAAAYPNLRILIDSRLGQSTGGTGVSFDWTAAQTVLSTVGRPLKLIVAGGLRPQNVAQAIASLNPWGVDVASGVESSLGRKSPEKLAAFIAAARKSPTP